MDCQLDVYCYSGRSIVETADVTFSMTLSRQLNLHIFDNWLRDIHTWARWLHFGEGNVIARVIRRRQSVVASRTGHFTVRTVPENHRLSIADFVVILFQWLTSSTYDIISFLIAKYYSRS